MTCGITLNNEDYWFQNLWFSGFIPELTMAAIEIFGDNTKKTIAMKMELEGHWPGKVYDLDTECIDGISKYEMRMIVLRALKYQQSCKSGPGAYDAIIEKLTLELKNGGSRS